MLHLGQREIIPGGGLFDKVVLLLPETSTHVCSCLFVQLGTGDTKSRMVPTLVQEGIIKEAGPLVRCAAGGGHTSVVTGSCSVL